MASTSLSPQQPLWGRTSLAQRESVEGFGEGGSKPPCKMVEGGEGRESRSCKLEPANFPRHERSGGGGSVLWAVPGSIIRNRRTDSPVWVPENNLRNRQNCSM